MSAVPKSEEFGSAVYEQAWTRIEPLLTTGYKTELVVGKLSLSPFMESSPHIVAPQPPRGVFNRLRERFLPTPTDQVEVAWRRADIGSFTHDSMYENPPVSPRLSVTDVIYAPVNPDPEEVRRVHYTEAKFGVHRDDDWYGNVFHQSLYFKLVSSQQPDKPPTEKLHVVIGGVDGPTFAPPVHNYQFLEEHGFTERFTAASSIELLELCIGIAATEASRD